MPRSILALASLALVAGCFSPSYSDSQPFLCQKDTKDCPDGYTCNTEVATGDPALGVCEKPAGTGDSTKCVDADLEPNDTPATASALAWESVHRMPSRS